MNNPKRINLYEHNKTAYEKVENMLAEENLAAVIHPTGTGKSFIAFALTCAHPDKCFLWLAPSEYIYNLQIDNLRKEQHIKIPNVVFRTYVWLMRNEDKISSLKPDFIILDEFHRAGAVEWGKSVQSLLEAYPKAKVLGLTATNVRYLDNQRDMAEELFQGNVASEIGLCEAIAKKILPEPKYVVSVYAFEEKLREYDGQVKKLKNKKQREKTEKLLEKLRRTLEQADGVNRVLQKHMPSDDAKVIIFCANSEHMMDMIARVPEWFGRIDSNPHIYHVYSYNPESEEDFRKFVEDDSNHLKLLYCIDMLNEGIHVDDVDAVVLCRPTTSPIVYKQQIGRAIATGSSRTPVIFDMVNNFDNLYQIDALKEELDEFKTMYAKGEGDSEYIDSFEIIDELRDCRMILEQIQKNLDSTWDIYYQELIRYKKRSGDVMVPSRYVTDDGLFLGRWLQRQKAIYQERRLSKEKIQMLESLGVEWKSQLDQRFDEWVERLIEYKNEYGNLDVPVRHETKDGYNLGTFCYNIRGRYKAGKLTKDRIDTLEAIGFRWDTFSAYWQEGYKHAEEYFKENGDLHVPKRYICEDGYKLGLWVYTQRAVRKGRVPGNLDETKIQRLDQLGMEWDVKVKDNFDKCLKSYKKYKEETGEAMIPFSYVDETGLNLGAWAARINRLYFADKLPEDRKKRLLSEGFVFNRISKQWRDHYEEAKAFYNRNGNLLIPVSYISEHGGTLNQWVINQRVQYNKPDHGRLYEEQVDLLEQIHINDPDKQDRSFIRGVEELKRYIEEYHDNLVPTEYKTTDGYELGRWLLRQRTKRERGQLTEKQIQILNEAGMDWEKAGKRKSLRHFEEMFEEAKKYAKEHGSMKNMPFEYVTEDGKHLGSWVQQLRKIRSGQASKSIILTDELIESLDALGINWGKSGG